MATEDAARGGTGHRALTRPERRPSWKASEPAYVHREDEAADHWDGESTELRVGFPVCRSQKLYGRGDTITVKASWDERRSRWLGPEADHVRQLIADGLIDETEPFYERIAGNAKVMADRGVTATERTEYRPIEHPKQMPTLVRRDLEGDPSKMKERELAHVNAGVEALVKALGRAFAGSQAPGTAAE